MRASLAIYHLLLLLTIKLLHKINLMICTLDLLPEHVLSYLMSR